MKVKRALIIGPDKDLCSPIREFLESMGLITTLVLSYKEGIDRLFYEEPDLIVLEAISRELSPSLINKINSSDCFKAVNINNNIQIKEGVKPVLILEETNQINTLFDFLRSYMTKEETKSSSREIEEEGDLSLIPYPSLLASFYHNKRTGILTINSRVTLKIYLTDGVPIFAEGGDVETALGRILTNSRRISESDYEKAVDIATEKRQRVGEVLVGMGLISPHELNGILEFQVKEKIIRGFRYTQGTYSFKPGSDFVGRIVTYQINIPQVLYEGIKRFIDVSRIEGVLSIKEKSPSIRLGPDLGKKISSVGFGPKELRFIQNLRDKASVNDIVKTSRLDRDEVLKLLYFLYLLGLLEIQVASISETQNRSSQKSDWEKEFVKDIRENESRFPQEDVILLEEEVPETELKPIKKEADEGVASEQVEDSVDGQKKIIDDTSRKEIEIELGQYQEKTGEVLRFEQFRDSVDEQPKIDKTNIKTEQPRDSLSKETKTMDEEARRRKREAILDEILNFQATLREKNYYEILGVTKEATKDEVKNAYFNLVKKFHPDANPDFGKYVKEKTEEIFSAITTAYETLYDDRKRKEYDSQFELVKLKKQARSLYEAEFTYREGEALLKQRRYSEAENKFKRAVDLNPDEAAYIGALAWATFLAAEDKNRVLNEVKKRLEEAIALNPNVAENYYYLGCVYKHFADTRKAEANFLKAVKCDPDFIEAKRELRLLEQRRVEKNIDKKREKKFWSSLFKK
jgi:tetratricopeptide (TPR) repeat protein